MKKKSANSDKIKLALIPVLGVVLLAVLPESGDESDVIVPELVSHEQNIKSTGSKDRTTRREIQWPGHSLRTVVTHNPFVLSDPRAELDQSFQNAGLTGETEFTEVTPGEFFQKTTIGPGQENAATGIEDLIASIADSQAAGIVASRETTGTDTVANSESLSTPLAVDEEIRSRKLRLVELQNQPVTMFMQTRSGTSALVGSRRVIEGDMIEDGIRVAAISRHGITFQIVDPKHSPDSSLESQKTPDRKNMK